MTEKGDVPLTEIQKIEKNIISIKKEVQKLSIEIDEKKEAGIKYKKLEDDMFYLIHRIDELESEKNALLYGPELQQVVKKEPKPFVPAAMAALNGIIAVGVGWYYLSVLDMFGFFFFELFVIIMCSVLFLGAGLIAARSYKIGAIFCVIGGLLTFPLGLIGLVAAEKAWAYSKLD